MFALSISQSISLPLLLSWSILKGALFQFLLVHILYLCKDILVTIFAILNTNRSNISTLHFWHSCYLKTLSSTCN